MNSRWGGDLARELDVLLSLHSPYYMDMLTTKTLSNDEDISEMEKVEYVMTGGGISQRLVDICHKKGVKIIYGVKKGNITKKPENMRVVPIEEA